MSPGWKTLLTLLMAATVAAQPTSPADPTPQTIDEFRTSAERILREAAVPGAGITLVRTSGVEWEGGIGYADRERQALVTADTHFRVGSISKTFVAMAIVQLYFDDLLMLDATVESVAPEIAIENRWHATDPVRVIHLLQHTAGFDDMHFNEIYNRMDPPDISLLDVLRRNPKSRQVRWRPGTRMSYSNPGYGVAGYLIEKVAKQPFEDYIKEKILNPTGMPTSSFRLDGDAEPLMAQGYRDASGPPTGFPRIYWRPAGNLHSSPKEMGRFVRLLLNWGELDDEYVIDPEYLGNMERSSTSLAAAAGLRNTYGSGIFWDYSLPFAVLGHDGGIEGFTSTYGYSPSRDVGYAFLLNSSSPQSGQAIRRLSSLAIRFLKRDVEPAAPPQATGQVPLSTYEGFYQDANPRNALIWPWQRLFTGRFVTVEGGQLYMRRRGGETTRLVPVSETTFRRETDLDATLVFTTDAEGNTVLAGSGIYAERTPRWSVEALRAALFTAVGIALSPLLVAVMWVARLAHPMGRRFWDLRAVLLATPLVMLAPAAALSLTPWSEWGSKNWPTITVFLSSLTFPDLALVIALLAVAARRNGAERRLVAYAGAVVIAIAAISWYLWRNGLFGLRLWAY